MAQNQSGIGAGGNWIYIDDTDNRLDYSGQWELTTGDTPQRQGNSNQDSNALNDISSSWSGKVWNNTVHKTRDNDSMVIFGFNGTGYAVYGSFLTGASSKGRINCFLDGLDSLSDLEAGDSISWSPPESIDQGTSLGGNNDFICGREILESTGPHSLKIKMDNIVNASFFLDYVLIYQSGLESVAHQEEGNERDEGVGSSGGGDVSQGDAGMRNLRTPLADTLRTPCGHPYFYCYGLISCPNHCLS
ncbi:hypothetical protein D9758_010597 [Tetrapyrgos nigripes]|uniref:Uncharacterized protein n=1 Tax=Tetrapyrgos nigripes TaxID=182062 RepID=A0A8H5D612_9AGAR|nr:hypothetical protein D9758_010597 [Tetrapyrgos nigripes]